MTVTERLNTALVASNLTIKSVTLRKVLAPLPKPLKTASGQLTHAAVLLIDLKLSGGLTGVSYLFSPRADMLNSLAETVSALANSVQDMPCNPLDISKFWDRGYLLFGGTGVVTMARAALDMAMWDAISKDQGKPFYQLLGGTEAPIRAYESSGLGLSDAQEVADEAMAYTRNGFKEMKVRLGYATLDQDIEILEAVRVAVGPDIGLMVDYNQSLSRDAARDRCHALDAFGLLWIEEPLIAQDLEGAAILTDDLKTPIQLGENLFSDIEIARALELKSCDYLMPDVMKIGGATGWLRAADAAQKHAIPISSHLFPEISIHLLAIVENRHFLEYVNWMDAILEEPLQPENGFVRPSKSPGTGIGWNAAAVAKYLI